MRIDKQYLQLHGQQWRVVIKVPDRLRAIIGKPHLKHPLHTNSLAVANREKLKHVLAFRQQIEEAEAKLRQRAGRQADLMVEEALRWRDALAEDDDEGSADYALGVWHEEISRAHGEDRADTLGAIAKGLATPLTSLIEDWLAERNMKPRQVLDYRRAVLKLDAWCRAAKVPGTVEGVTRKAAGRYITEAFVKPKVHWKTANKDISCLSSFWKWLEPKGYAKENVWKGQSLQKQRQPAGTGKRPYTDAEVAKLLTADAPPFLRDAITIAAASGMRIEEIAQLRAASIVDGCMDIKDAKTAAGERKVPIHSAITDIIERRCKDKAPKAFLFHELPGDDDTMPLERSTKIVKAFTRYRRAIGVDDRVEGARQSRVDLHSLRRWFMKSAREAMEAGAKGFTPWTLADVVGHDAKEMALGLTMAQYPGPSSIASRRACVEAVKLPSTVDPL